MQGDGPERCSHTLDPEQWEREHDEPCQIDPEDDADILETGDGRQVWRCPHPAIEGHAECVFHLPPEECPEDADSAEEFLAIIDGERDALDGDGRRPPQFIEATFENLDIDRERFGADETIDLRHAHIGDMMWVVESVDAPIDASGAVIEDRCECKRGTTFVDANFGGATFDGGATFEDADLEGATIRDADFRGVCLEDANLEGADLRDAEFAEAQLEGAVLTRTQLYGTDFTDARLHGTLFGDARISDGTRFVERGTASSVGKRLLPVLNAVPFLDRNEANTVIYDPRTEPVYGDEYADADAGNDGADDPEDGNHDEIGNETKGEAETSAENEEQAISNYTRAAAVYATLESLARDNAASTLASTSYVWRKDMERGRRISDKGRENERERWLWLRSWASNLVVRYGESPYRILTTAVLVVVSCGLAYDALNLIGRVCSSPPCPPSPPPVTLFDAMYFSTLTFTTLGLGDFRPQEQLGQILAIAETSAGVILLALLVFVFGRRATR